MREVFLSELAAGKLDNLLTYLEEEWSINISLEFLKRFEEKLNQVSHFPESCPSSERYPNLFRCVITKQTSFLYRILVDKIEIITIFDNRMNFNSLQDEIRKHYGKL